MDIPCLSRFAKVDCKDTSVSDGSNLTADLIAIGKTSIKINISPDHFDVNSTNFNFSGGTYTYLSQDLNMSASTKIDITAKNAEGNTTVNYDKSCYSNNVIITASHSVIPDPLSSISYLESTNNVSGSVSKGSDISGLNFTKTIFDKGIAKLVLDYNFDRDSLKPLNPFDFNISKITVVDSVGLFGSGIPLGVEKFVYGRVSVSDITSTENIVSNPVYYEVFSTIGSGFVNGMEQTVLHWYKNKLHTGSDYGTVFKGAFLAGGNDVNVIPEGFNSGIQNINVSNGIEKTVHLDTSTWLWNSPKSNYDYSGTCINHLCFDIKELKQGSSTSSGYLGVNSGSSETSFDMAPANNITAKGTKVFR
jgi:hypothetical protein